MGATGSLTIADLLQTRFASAKAFGIGTLVDVLQRDLEAHNAAVNSMLSDLCEITTDARRLYGTSNDAWMTEVDEFGRAPSQKFTPGAEVAFPLKAFQYAVGWDRKYLETATVADIAQKQLDAEKAHLREIQRQIKKAIFNDDNYTFRDYLVDNVDLGVKRFLNADSTNIPDGPNGETFAGASHTHYTAATPFVVANATALINTVAEHGHASKIILAINVAQETTVRGFSGFNAYIDPRLIVPGGATTGVPGARLDITRLDNRAIGILGVAEVWVKSWVPSGYQFAYDAADGRKPLAFRQRNATALQGLRLGAKLETYPLYADYFEAEFGIGVLTRTNGACNYVGASWTDATIA